MTEENQTKRVEKTEKVFAKQTTQENHLNFEIISYSGDFKNKAVHFILNILEGEFGLRDVKRPDIYEIESFYQNKNGNFWIAVAGTEVIGTVALKDYGEGQGYIKRLYVRKDMRRRGIASKLISELLLFAKDKEYSSLYLGTISEMSVAVDFYKKRGFRIIPALPYDLPSFGDTVFMELELE